MSTSPRPASSARAIFLSPCPLLTSRASDANKKAGHLSLSPRMLSGTRAAMLIPFGAKSSKPKIAEHRGRKDYG